MLASIEGRARNYLAGHPGSSSHREHVDFQRRYLAEHQPEGGAYGAPCLGAHNTPTAWPCEEVKNLDQPGAYLD
ncbi:hypothetical protein TSHO111613_10845 [Tsukamurella hominis]